MEPTLEEWASAGFDLICALIGQTYGLSVGSDPQLQADCVATCQVRWDALKDSFTPPGFISMAVDGFVANYGGLIAHHVEWAQLCISNPEGAAVLRPGATIVDQEFLDAMLALQAAHSARPDTVTALGL